MYNVPCIEIPIDKVNIDEALRNVIDDIEPLKYSIQSHGVREPIIVSRTDTGYNIVNGYRRILACLELGRTIIKAIIYEDLDSVEQKTIALELDITHRNLRWQERAKALKELYNIKKKYHSATSARFGRQYTQTQFAKDLHLSNSTISNLLNLANMMETHPDIMQYGSYQKALSKMRDIREGIVEQTYHQDSVKEVFLRQDEREVFENIKPIYELVIFDIKGHVNRETVELAVKALAQNGQIIIFCPLRDFGTVLDYCQSLGLNYDQEPYFWRPTQSNITEVFLWASREFSIPPRTISRSHCTPIRGVATEFSQDKPYDLWYYFFNRLTVNSNSIFLPYCYSLNAIRAGLDMERNLYAFNQSTLIYEHLILQGFNRE